MIRRFALAAALAVAAAASPAYAQIAGAIGKPLPASDTPVGTVTVKVIAGMVTKPVVGTEVTLLVNGTPRSARTDSEGHASFPDLPVGATVQAKVQDDDKKDVTSDEFPVPDDTGARVMITTKPFVPLGGGGGAPFAGGAGGMPDPRQVSGQPRPEQKNGPGEVSILVVYGALTDVVQNVPVTLVGYSWDGKLSVKVQQTDATGHATFVDLDRSGGTAYYALAELARNGTSDRLMSYPIQLDSQVGVALLLSGDKRDAKSLPVDELGRYEPQVGIPAGKVRVMMRGLVVGSNQVELVDAQTTQVVGHTTPTRGDSEIGDVQPSAEVDPRTDEKPGTFDVTIHGGPKGEDKPLPNVTLQVQAAGDDKAPPTTGSTDDKGHAHFELAAGSYTVTVVFNDKPMTSQPFDLTKGGTDLAVGLSWDATPRLIADFDVAPKDGQTLYARTLGKGGDTDVYRSLPFHVVADRGTTASILVAPHVVFNFRMVSEVDDTQLAVRGLFDVENLTWAPFRGSPDGLVIPLPKHFKGAVVTENEQQIASVDANEGFRMPHPLPPLRTQFHGGFSLATDNGAVDWQLDLPYGAFQSDLRIVPFAGMKVDLPKGVHGGEITMEDGMKLYDVGGISIERGKSMQLTIRGLPSQPGWKVWMPRIVGVLVVMMMLGGLGYAFAFLRRQPREPSEDPVRVAKRTKLMDELVELDRNGATSGKDRKRRDTLLAELEKLWD
jgi:hypothetical protein|nr:hypothetical protein [Kofleriaceae bacterium]